MLGNRAGQEPTGGLNNSHLATNIKQFRPKKRWKIIRAYLTFRRLKQGQTVHKTALKVDRGRVLVNLILKEHRNKLGWTGRAI